MSRTCCGHFLDISFGSLKLFRHWLDIFVTSQWGRQCISDMFLTFSGYLICSLAGPARQASPVQHIQPSGALGRSIFSYFLEACPESGWPSQVGQPSPISPTERHFKNIFFPHLPKSLLPVRPAQPSQLAQSSLPAQRRAAMFPHQFLMKTSPHQKQKGTPACKINQSSQLLEISQASLEWAQHSCWNESTTG